LKLARGVREMPDAELVVELRRVAERPGGVV
jgi:hypothetical protein